MEGKVKYLLDTFPELRDRGVNYLVAKYWSTFDHVDVSPEYIAKLTKTETIRRTKQKIVEKEPDKYGPTKLSIAEARQISEIAHQEYAVSDKK